MEAQKRRVQVEEGGRERKRVTAKEIMVGWEMGAREGGREGGRREGGREGGGGEGGREGGRREEEGRVGAWVHGMCSDCI